MTLSNIGGRRIPVEIGGPLPGQDDDLVMTVEQRKGTKSAPAAKAPTTAALLLLASNASRISALLSNAGSVTVYLGRGNSVAATTGIPLAPGASLTDTDSTDDWWGITASGTGDIRVLEVSE